MIKKIILSSIALFAIIKSNAQSPVDNLGFESSSIDLPTTLWQQIGSNKYTYTVSTDVVKEGKQSLVINNQDKQSSYGDFGGIYFEFPNTYVGKEMELTVYLKTSEVAGTAGIFYKTDARMPIQYAEVKGINGTNDWQKISLKKAIKQSHIDQIGIGVMLKGSGIIWVDQVELKIDGKDYKNSEVYTKPTYKADLDKMFDNGSEVVIPSNYNEEDLDKLTLLGQLWGFLKYHHPMIAKGEYNWDYELFRMLPKYLSTKTEEQRDQFLLSWIDSLGTLPKPLGQNGGPIDMTWISKYDLNQTLQNRLKQVANYPLTDEHYYLTQGRYVPIADYINERPYAQFTLPDTGFRLLALYRYWNMVEYFYPYKDLTDNKWSEVLRNYLKPFINASTELEYELALTALLTELNDSHAMLLGGNKAIELSLGEYYAPIRLNKIEGKWIVTEIYNPELLNGLEIKVGDEVTHINQESLITLEARNRNRYPASNDAVYYRDLQRDLLRSPKEMLNITYMSGNKSKSIDLKLYKRNELNIYYTFKVDKTKKGYYLLNNNIGYITLANINDGDIEEIKKQFSETKGIIIDARNYPSAFVPYSLGGYFVSEPTPFLKNLLPTLNFPGTFEFSKELTIKPVETKYKGNVVVLINEVSQSASEYAIMAFKAGDNVTLVGTPTAGTNGDTAQVVLPGNRVALIGGAGIYYPNECYTT
ncbi:S41 family peptidase [Myroides odoratimimus]|uniref:Tail specific protease domain-containing protein n=1 Tax=Myroides odoratimimus CIP 101113 TaxID=883154 RepID=A0AAV3F1N2_9FLAO|nr:S41 family peptidase [Myroides odoratimimus]EHO09525.1 hypothetical protein HMPREF9715_02369 [Myroides odoratimimus CIP 101113]